MCNQAPVFSRVLLMQFRKRNSELLFEPVRSQIYFQPLKVQSSKTMSWENVLFAIWVRSVQPAVVAWNTMCSKRRPCHQLFVISVPAEAGLKTMEVMP